MKSLLLALSLASVSAAGAALGTAADLRTLFHSTVQTVVDNLID